MRHAYFNLAIPASTRLNMMRADFSVHANKYPHCPASARPKTWRDMRGTTHKSFGAHICALSQGFNGGEPVWCCYTGGKQQVIRNIAELREAREELLVATADYERV